MEISNEDFKKLIYQATDMITDWYDKKLRGSKIYNNKSPAVDWMNAKSIDVNSNED